MGLRKGGRKIILIAITTTFFLLPCRVFGTWIGPAETVTGSWGSGERQFGLVSQDTADRFPIDFGVDKNGVISIADLVNQRVQIFNQDGSIYKLINKPSELNVTFWPRSLIVSREGNSLLANLYIYNYSGNIICKITAARSERYGTAGGYIIKDLNSNQYLSYSPTGQLINTSTMRPLELGVVSEQSLGSGQYKVTVKYPDKEWTIVGTGVLPKYMRDLYGNLYGFGEVQAIRYTNCGKELAVLTMPQNKIQEISRGPAVEPKIKVLEEYGSPVVAPNGDVYTWKRTPDKYSILKWTWVDDPNIPTGPDAPAGLSILPSTTGLYLTWTASPHDPGCVTGYEIARATSAGGVYTTLTTADKGVVKYNDTTATAGTMYYYKVRAKAGTEYSNYTGEVSGKR